MCNMGDSPLLALEKKSESEDKTMRLPLRMKKAGKNVVPTLMMMKSWISYRIIISYGAHEKSDFTRLPRKPNSTEGQKAKWDPQRLSSGRVWETDVAAKQRSKK